MKNYEISNSETTTFCITYRDRQITKYIKDKQGKMAIKKRTTLRSKSVKRVGNAIKEDQKKEKIIDKLAEKKEQEVKQHIIKSSSVIINEQNKSNDQISKSSLRRRKRKLRDQLRPKLTEDLLNALTESTNTKIEKTEEGNERVIIEERIKLDHKPNPLNKRGEMALLKIENEEFKNVLKNKELRNGNGLLASLKNSILLNLSKE